jgi:hypothetical protein
MDMYSFVVIILVMTHTRQGVHDELSLRCADTHILSSVSQHSCNGFSDILTNSVVVGLG